MFESYRRWPEIPDNVRRALAGEEVAATVEIGDLTFDTRYSPTWNEAGEVTGVIGVASDVTDRRRLEKELEFRAFHDSLTGLPNRALFSDRLEHALELGSRQTRSLSILFLDLDDFKLINDARGHTVGDGLLQAVAERLLSCVRPEDTVARLAGDEFALLLEGTDRDAALQVAHRVEEALASPFVIEGCEVTATVSIGIVVEETGGETDGKVGEILRAADFAMYRIKHNGKASHRVFDPAQDTPEASLVLCREQQEELQRAIEQEELELHYQCMQSLGTGRIVGFETLVRWAHPERGLLPPGEFIPLAEESGLIVDLGGWILRQACKQAGRWREQHPELPPLQISVNLSPRQLAHPALVEQVASTLEESSLALSLLLLEITESAAIESYSATGEVLEELKALGVRIAADDFGTGYSSITYLTQYPGQVLSLL